jgi:zinc transporter, ZIP family
LSETSSRRTEPRSRSSPEAIRGGIGLARALATVFGGTVLTDAPPELIGGARALAAGAVLAVVSISIIPHAFDEVSSTARSPLCSASWRDTCQLSASAGSYK